uniref:Uncharacterized protein n=1 Tax=Nelumbo nucifera TaxID=4432 RepID=A0A822YP46_NELNU|nr:TPA_asm: hypothetical protein HUJ06_011626 [Nelumbo nucifera]
MLRDSFGGQCFGRFFSGKAFRLDFEQEDGEDQPPIVRCSANREMEETRVPRPTQPPIWRTLLQGLTRILGSRICE